MKKDTLIIKAGRHPEQFHGAVNPPVYHASTVLFPTLAALEEASRQRFDVMLYGRFGTPTSFAFEEAMADFEGGGRTIAVSSGLAAAAVTLLCVLKAGDHLLMTDSVYGPVRNHCDAILAGFGIETTYYDPTVGGAIAELIRPNTRLIYMESPGSQSFELQDVPAIVAAAKAKSVLTAMDNTWATPYFFKPRDHGVDFSILAATKYVVGHSDAMLGAVTVDTERFLEVKTTANLLGNCAAPEACHLALRGLRTLPVRLRQHQVNAERVIAWLRDRPEVERVIYPALAEHPGHAIWKRDFSGAASLFSMILRKTSKSALAAMLDGLEHFGIGASFGGFESLILPVRPERLRTATRWRAAGPVLRLHVGLEDPEDLIADLEQGFARLNQKTAGAAAG